MSFQIRIARALITSSSLLIVTIGCDELGLRIGPSSLPPPVPVDQTAAAALANSDTNPTKAPSQHGNDESPISSPGDRDADRSENNAVARLKPYEDWTYAETAIDSLGRIGKSAVGPLVESLDDPNPVVRYRSAAVLARIGPDAFEAVPALVRHLNDVDESVRREAARAIGQIGPKASEAVPQLIDAIRADEQTP